MGILNQNFRNLNFKSIFKPIRKFSRLIPKIKKITLDVLKLCQVSRNFRNIFFSFIIHSSFIITTRFARGAQEGGVGVREANYVRVSKLRQVYKLRQECKLRQLEGH